jgi:hypothetical protein
MTKQKTLVPMSPERRAAVYARTNGTDQRLTPAQDRRIRKAARKAQR